MNRESLLRVRSLLRKEFRQLFRDPKAKRIMFGAPLLQLMLFGYAVNTDVHNVPMHVVDYDRTAASRELQEALVAGGYFDIVAVSERPRDLEGDLDAGRVGVGVVIPRGFARDLAAGRGAQVQLLVDGSSSNTGTVAQGYATRIIQQFGVSRIIFEAPTPASQMHFIKVAGSNVNLGNINPQSLLLLETQRVGLRSETFHVE